MVKEENVYFCFSCMITFEKDYPKECDSCGSENIMKTYNASDSVDNGSRDLY